MSGSERLIIVIDTADDRARNLKDLIEFMDVPVVGVAAPDNWQAQIGDYQLAAIFLGSDLPQREFKRLIDDIGKFDPNVPIVLVDGGPHA